ncbi:hypothetical protein [Ligilactobacillus agilis]|nr:hypothetical protein [Ligilactobacillus agilis]
MWIPNSIVALIVFAAICTLTKKAWLKYQANKQLKHLDYNTNTEKEK